MTPKRPILPILSCALALGAAIPLAPASAQTQAEAPEPLGIRGTIAEPAPMRIRPPRPARPPPTARPVRPPLRAIPERPFRGQVRAPVAALAEPAEPLVVPRRRRPVEEDPYAPLGLRLGTLVVVPGVEQSVGWDSNPNRVAAPARGSRVYRTDADLLFRSDWSTHEFTAFLRGGYSFYPDVKGADRPDAEGRVALRLDATRDTRIDLDGRFRLDTERPGSPELGVDASERPLIVTGGASAGVTHRFNRLSVGLRGSIDRNVYESARLTDGSILDQSDRDRTQYGARLRAAYELTPGVSPFVEALADTRVHDERIDRSGFRRDSDGFGARVGSTFEITRTLTGEASAGFQRRRYEDPRLRDITGPVAEAALVWSATPLTTVRLRGQSLIEDTTIPNASGALARTAALEVQHDLRRNLSVTLAASYTDRDYRGVFLKEEVKAGSVRLDYRLTRSLALRASFTHERLKSSTPGSDYTANVFLIGLRLQR
ncbi:MAG TPA: outer membrane beta-barrel protein [Beijerinckiaceae bacterium]|nr:outer membrane beta-barrel protein [Beijerinckiaceae bacterium]